MVGAPSTNSIYVCNLPPGTDEILLAEHFGTIGVLKKDKRTGRPKIWIYRDKSTNAPKGDATVTYEDPYAASAAVEWFNNKDFHGNIISVYIAETKNKESAEPTTAPKLAGYDMEPSTTEAVGDADSNWTGAAGGRGRGLGEPGGKAWQQEGDWLCPNPSCTNVNFAFRGVCNRCGTARPAGAGGGGGFGGGRGRGRRGGADGGDRGRGPGGPPGLFGPNDWTCPMCENINWAKRTKCNICNTTKPGLNEGGVREGRAGGYKELDEAELEETKRRRREAEEDDGEMYDEFGNLKKKFRVKAKQGEAVLIGGKAGWANEDLGVVEREKARERGNERNRESDWKSRGDDGHNGYRSSQYDEYNSHKDGSHDRGREREHRDHYDYNRERSSEGSRDDYRERERSRERDRDRDRDRGRGKERDRFREAERDRDRDGGYARERERGRERFMD
ncbi:hypothetical protein GOP47_0021646 [Adiantum capillus-veneris]|uniref:Transcription initiation factor TFIID subunit 15 n=1 Tax=Adiantum capillus-veneris TaxID=13818 RepID=A0A9D4Z6F7_ADICA|nr:hypothetical protein GOP47_0021646 [Adiantum capillus-veneris]